MKISQPNVPPVALKLAGELNVSSGTNGVSKSQKTTERPSMHICNTCGACCRAFAYIQLSQNEITVIESFTGLAAEEFSNSGERNGEKRFMKFKENGDCVFLNITDGAYSCCAYEARSNICREYPASDIQETTCRINRNRQKL